MHRNQNYNTRRIDGKRYDYRIDRSDSKIDGASHPNFAYRRARKVDDISILLSSPWKRGQSLWRPSWSAEEYRRLLPALCRDNPSWSPPWTPDNYELMQGSDFYDNPNCEDRFDFVNYLYRWEGEELIKTPRINRPSSYSPDCQPALHLLDKNPSKENLLTKLRKVIELAPAPINSKAIEILDALELQIIETSQMNIAACTRRTDASTQTSNFSPRQDTQTEDSQNLNDWESVKLKVNQSNDLRINEENIDLASSSQVLKNTFREEVDFFPETDSDINRELISHKKEMENTATNNDHSIISNGTNKLTENLRTKVTQPLSKPITKTEKTQIVENITSKLLSPSQAITSSNPKINRKNHSLNEDSPNRDRVTETIFSPIKSQIQPCESEITFQEISTIKKSASPSYNAREATLNNLPLNLPVSKEEGAILNDSFNIHGIHPVVLGTNFEKIEKSQLPFNQARPSSCPPDCPQELHLLEEDHLIENLLAKLRKVIELAPASISTSAIEILDALELQIDATSPMNVAVTTHGIEASTQTSDSSPKQFTQMEDSQKVNDLTNVMVSVKQSNNRISEESRINPTSPSQVQKTISKSKTGTVLERLTEISRYSSSDKEKIETPTTNNNYSNPSNFTGSNWATKLTETINTDITSPFGKPITKIKGAQIVEKITSKPLSPKQPYASTSPKTNNENELSLNENPPNKDRKTETIFSSIKNPIQLYQSETTFQTISTSKRQDFLSCIAKGDTFNSLPFNTPNSREEGTVQNDSFNIQGNPLVVPSTNLEKIEMSQLSFNQARSSSCPPDCLQGLYLLDKDPSQENLLTKLRKVIELAPAPISTRAIEILDVLEAQIIETRQMNVVVCTHRTEASTQTPDLFYKQCIQTEDSVTSVEASIEQSNNLKFNEEKIHLTSPSQVLETILKDEVETISERDTDISIDLTSNEEEVETATTNNDNNTDISTDLTSDEEEVEAATTNNDNSSDLTSDEEEVETTTTNNDNSNLPNEPTKLTENVKTQVSEPLSIQLTNIEGTEIVDLPPKQATHTETSFNPVVTNEKSLSSLPIEQMMQQALTPEPTEADWNQVQLPVLLMYPTQYSKEDSTTVRQWLEKVFRIPPIKFRESKDLENGGFAITFDTREDVRKFELLIKQDKTLSTKVTTSYPEKVIHPSAILYNVPENITKEDIKLALLKSAGIDKELKIRFKYKASDASSVNWILETPSTELKKLKKLKKIFIKRAQIQIKEFFNFNPYRKCVTSHMTTVVSGCSP